MYREFGDWRARAALAPFLTRKFVSFDFVGITASCAGEKRKAPQPKVLVIRISTIGGSII